MPELSADAEQLPRDKNDLVKSKRNKHTWRSDYGWKQSDHICESIIWARVDDCQHSQQIWHSRIQKECVKVISNFPDSSSDWLV
ncbi:hypothetical protein A0H81_00883 [Grifola frondosa]|uniref:Uncharacterized protein n=1 Tax=Grifola frondosa TaxID=5627 RepID=A0A1C7MSD5_GRIFR|nr:hypothetical protein A0H81_00883 [Grifola frondosa]